MCVLAISYRIKEPAAVELNSKPSSQGANNNSSNINNMSNDNNGQKQQAQQVAGQPVTSEISSLSFFRTLAIDTRDCRFIRLKNPTYQLRLRLDF